MQRLFTFILAAICAMGSVQKLNAQNTSPYWSLAGNSNATSSSKLGTTTAVDLRLFANNAERLRILNANGFVGIGTANPQQRLHVEGASNQAIFVSTTAPGATSGSGMIGSMKALPTGSGNRLGYFLTGSRGGAENGYNAAGMVGYSGGAWSSSSHPAYLTFETTPAGLATRQERLRITADGDVGIGTTTPTATLEVDGSSGDTHVGIYAHALTGVIGSGEIGVLGQGDGGDGVRGETYTESSDGVSGSAYGDFGIGVSGLSRRSYGVYGRSDTSNGTGVYGEGYNGVYGLSGKAGGQAIYGSASGTNTWGVRGYSANSIGVYGSTGNSSSYAGYFAGNVYTTGTYTSSDQSLKSDIAEVSSAMDIINKLKPKSYNFKQDGDYKQMNLPQGKHYGLIAQEVEQVLPGLVKATTFDVNRREPDTARRHQAGAQAASASKTISFKALNYTELIPIVIKGMQEQQQENNDLKARVAKLEDLVNRLTTGGGVISMNGGLSQNTPNPSNGITRISYNLPTGANHAQLVITDASGKTIRALLLNGSGNVDLNTASLSSGVYNYSLIVDGKNIETKKLVIAR